MATIYFNQLSAKICLSLSFEHFAFEFLKKNFSCTLEDLWDSRLFKYLDRKMCGFFTRAAFRNRSKQVSERELPYRARRSLQARSKITSCN